MNIFVTSRCPEESAIRLWNNPVRARKMITESLQLLAAYMESNGYTMLVNVNGNHYSTSKAILGNKVTKWVLKNHLHFEWLVDHLEALYDKYEGNGFSHVPDNMNILRKYTTDNYSGKYDGIDFHNQAAARSKKLDFKNNPCVFTAYDLYLKAQGD